MPAMTKTNPMPSLTQRINVHCLSWMYFLKVAAIALISCKDSELNFVRAAMDSS